MQIKVVRWDLIYGDLDVSHFLAKLHFLALRNNLSLWTLTMI